MPRRQLDPEEAKLKRQQRNERYRANPATKERNKEHDKLYRQNKRHRARQASPQDRLNQLMDIVTQQQCLEAENDTMDEGMIIESMGGEEGIVDANNMMEEDGENFRDGHWNEGFPDEVESDMNEDGDDESSGGFGDDSIDSDMNDDGSQIVIYY